MIGGGWWRGERTEQIETGYEARDGMRETDTCKSGGMMETNDSRE